jgi:hypothetical protein
MEAGEERALAERFLHAVEAMAEALQCQARAIDRLSAAIEGGEKTYPAPTGVTIGVSS